MEITVTFESLQAAFLVWHLNNIDYPMTQEEHGLLASDPMKYAGACADTLLYHLTHMKSI